MKKLVLVFAVLLAANFGFSQGNWCGTDLHMEKLFENDPDLKKKYEDHMDAFNKLAIKPTVNNKGVTVYKIPLVIHVIHYNGVGLISKAQIDDGIRILNEDFNKENADTFGVRAVFKPYISDFQIEFELAKINPIGNPTEGVTRVNSHLTYGANNAVKGLAKWDVFSYLNVWIVSTIDIGSAGGGTTLGYAQFPGAGPTNYGLVVRADEWGSIEAAISTDGRTVTHEVGHCLNLYHPFQSACGSLCHATGDFVCDTPPQFDDNNNSCAQSLNTCSNDTQGGIASRPNPYTTNVPDQLENYMGYATGCQGMFSEGQKGRVYEAIANEIILDSITTSYNNIQTGTNPGYVGPMPKPIVEIYEFDRFICEGGSITFNEDSYGGPLTNYLWSFPGGSPATSTSPNPTVTYNTKGNYDISLRISNAGGADSISFVDYVHVNGVAADYSAYNFNETFENTSSFLNEWVVVDEYKAPTYDICNFASQSGNNSIWINNYTSVDGTKDQMVSPSLKLSDVISPSIAMDVSYKRRAASSNDKLRLYASVDCGVTWFLILNMLPSFYAYDNTTTGPNNFIPTNSTQWKTVSIPAQFIPAFIKTGDNVKFMIELEKDKGNNLFIDNFRVLGQPLGINDEAALEADFMLYPNPSSDQVNIKLNLLSPANTAKIYIQNVVGKVVEEVFVGSFDSLNYNFIVDTKKFSPGIYFITTELDGQRITRKLMVE